MIDGRLAVPREDSEDFEFVDDEPSMSKNTRACGDDDDDDDAANDPPLSWKGNDDSNYKMREEDEDDDYDTDDYVPEGKDGDVGEDDEQHTTSSGNMTLTFDQHAIGRKTKKPDRLGAKPRKKPRKSASSVDIEVIDVTQESTLGIYLLTSN